MVYLKRLYMHKPTIMYTSKLSRAHINTVLDELDSIFRAQKLLFHGNYDPSLFKRLHRLKKYIVVRKKPTRKPKTFINAINNITKQFQNLTSNDTTITSGDDNESFVSTLSNTNTMISSDTDIEITNEPQTNTYCLDIITDASISNEDDEYINSIMTNNVAVNNNSSIINSFSSASSATTTAAVNDDDDDEDMVDDDEDIIIENMTNPLNDVLSRRIRRSSTNARTSHPYVLHCTRKDLRKAHRCNTLCRNPDCWCYILYRINSMFRLYRQRATTME